MRKSTLFISTALTIFMLAVMFGVVSAYQDNVKNNNVIAQATKEPVIQQVDVVDVAASVPTLPAVISPEQAALIASEFMGETDVYGVEVVDYEGIPAFLVTFSSGKLVYISSTGEILLISEVKPVVVVAPSKNNNNGGNSNGGGGSPAQPQDHDDHDD